MKRGLILAAGLLAAALALRALFGAAPADGPAPEEHIDDASRAALEEVLRQDQE
ncbi:MAG: hypothetical protein ABFS41_01360 [Myxococcota bacterium]